MAVSVVRVGDRDFRVCRDDVVVSRPFDSRRMALEASHQLEAGNTSCTVWVRQHERTQWWYVFSQNAEWDVFGTEQEAREEAARLVGELNAAVASNSTPPATPPREAPFEDGWWTRLRDDVGYRLETVDDEHITVFRPDETIAGTGFTSESMACRAAMRDYQDMRRRALTFVRRSSNSTPAPPTPSPLLFVRGNEERGIYRQQGSGLYSVRVGERYVATSLTENDAQAFMERLSYGFTPQECHELIAANQAGIIARWTEGHWHAAINGGIVSAGGTLAEAERAVLFNHRMRNLSGRERRRQEEVERLRQQGTVDNETARQTVAAGQEQRFFTHSTTVNGTTTEFRVPQATQEQIQTAQSMGYQVHTVSLTNGTGHEARRPGGEAMGTFLEFDAAWAFAVADATATAWRSRVRDFGPEIESAHLEERRRMLNTMVRQTVVPTSTPYDVLPAAGGRWRLRRGGQDQMTDYATRQDAVNLVTAHGGTIITDRAAAEAARYQTSYRGATGTWSFIDPNGSTATVHHETEEQAWEAAREHRDAALQRALANREAYEVRTHDGREYVVRQSAPADTWDGPSFLNHSTAAQVVQCLAEGYEVRQRGGSDFYFYQPDGQASGPYTSAEQASVMMVSRWFESGPQNLVVSVDPARGEDLTAISVFAPGHEEQGRQEIAQTLSSLTQLVSETSETLNRAADAVEESINGGIPEIERGTVLNVRPRFIERQNVGTNTYDLLADDVSIGVYPTRDAAVDRIVGFQASIDQAYDAGYRVRPHAAGGYAVYLDDTQVVAIDPYHDNHTVETTTEAWAWIIERRRQDALPQATAGTPPHPLITQRDEDRTIWLRFPNTLNMLRNGHLVAEVISSSLHEFTITYTTDDNRFHLYIDARERARSSSPDLARLIEEARVMALQDQATAADLVESDDMRLVPIEQFNANSELRRSVAHVPLDMPQYAHWNEAWERGYYVRFLNSGNRWAVYGPQGRITTQDVNMSEAFASLMATVNEREGISPPALDVIDSVQFEWPFFHHGTNISRYTIARFDTRLYCLLYDGMPVPNEMSFDSVDDARRRGHELTEARPENERFYTPGDRNLRVDFSEAREAGWQVSSHIDGRYSVVNPEGSTQGTYSNIYAAVYNLAREYRTSMDYNLIEVFDNTPPMSTPGRLDNRRIPDESMPDLERAREMGYRASYRHSDGGWEARAPDGTFLGNYDFERGALRRLISEVQQANTIRREGQPIQGELPAVNPNHIISEDAMRALMNTPDMDENGRRYEDLAHEVGWSVQEVRGGWDVMFQGHTRAGTYTSEQAANDAMVRIFYSRTQEGRVSNLFTVVHYQERFYVVPTGVPVNVTDHPSFATRPEAMQAAQDQYNGMRPQTPEERQTTIILNPTPADLAPGVDEPEWATQEWWDRVATVAGYSITWYDSDAHDGDIRFTVNFNGERACDGFVNETVARRWIYNEINRISNLPVAPPANQAVGYLGTVNYPTPSATPAPDTEHVNELAAIIRPDRVGDWQIRVSPYGGLWQVLYQDQVIEQDLVDREQAQLAMGRLIREQDIRLAQQDGFFVISHYGGSFRARRGQRVWTRRFDTEAQCWDHIINALMRSEHPEHPAQTADYVTLPSTVTQQTPAQGPVTPEIRAAMSEDQFARHIGFAVRHVSPTTWDITFRGLPMNRAYASEAEANVRMLTLSNNLRPALQAGWCVVGEEGPEGGDYRVRSPIGETINENTFRHLGEAFEVMDNMFRMVVASANPEQAVMVGDPTPVILTEREESGVGLSTTREEEDRLARERGYRLVSSPGTQTWGVAYQGTVRISGLDTQQSAAAIRRELSMRNLTTTEFYIFERQPNDFAISLGLGSRAPALEVSYATRALASNAVRLLVTEMQPSNEELMRSMGFSVRESGTVNASDWWAVYLHRELIRSDHSNREAAVRTAMRLATAADQRERATERLPLTVDRVPGGGDYYFVLAGDISILGPFNQRANAEEAMAHLNTRRMTRLNAVQSDNQLADPFLFRNRVNVHPTGAGWEVWASGQRLDTVYSTREHALQDADARVTFHDRINGERVSATTDQIRAQMNAPLQVHVTQVIASGKTLVIRSQGPVWYMTVDSRIEGEPSESYVLHSREELATALVNRMAAYRQHGRIRELATALVNRNVLTVQQASMMSGISATTLAGQEEVQNALPSAPPAPPPVPTRVPARVNVPRPQPASMRCPSCNGRGVHGGANSIMCGQCDGTGRVNRPRAVQACGVCQGTRQIWNVNTGQYVECPACPAAGHEAIAEPQRPKAKEGRASRDLNL